jgi:hypothetical protein
MACPQPLPTFGECAGRCASRLRAALSEILAAGVALMLAGCASAGDLGRERPSPFADDNRHWTTPPSVLFAERPALFMYTDDEKLLRRLAYNLITPPYPRETWDARILQFGRTREFRIDWYANDYRAYAIELASTRYRSASARYAGLSEDISNDIVTTEPFFQTAYRVADMDSKRDKALSHISGLTADEQYNAQCRIAENRMIVGWVYGVLQQRIVAYRYALERLVIATPSPMAVDAERTLNELNRRVAAVQVVVTTNPLAVAGAPGRGIVSK